MGRKDEFELLGVRECISRCAGFALTEKGKKLVLTLPPFNEKVLPFELTRIKEANDTIIVNGKFPIRNANDLTPSFTRARKGGTLEERELYSIAEEIEVAMEVKSYFSTLEEETPNLFEEASRLEIRKDLMEKIFSCIGPDLSVLDTASNKLLGVRKSISSTKKEIVSSLPSILSRYASFLTSMQFALKNGHYTLPVSASFKNVVRGLIQDISSSENTYFIEPEELLQKNAKLEELYAAERAEVARILGELSSLVRNDVDALSNNSDILADFDYLQAKVLYGESYSGHVGDLSTDGTLYLPNAFHPLLEVATIIKNDFSLNSKKRVVVLSGPNAGGKTVALKTLGLCVLFFKMAYLLPTAIGAEVPYFKNVYVEMGDNSSLEDNLSTFSAHISSLKEITDRIGGKDLALLDELGAGTSPLEGEALAKSMLDFLLEKHAYVFLSSHFEGVKEVGLSKSGVFSASMVFDKEKLEPTYHLEMGLPGDSYGLEVASRYGLDKKIVDKAKEYASSKVDISLGKAIEKLNALTAENRSLKEKLENREKDLERKEKALKSKEKALEMKEEKLLSDVEKRKQKILDDAKKEVEDALYELRSPNLKLHEAIKVKKKIENMEKVEETPLFNEDIKVGDFASIPSLGLEGRINKLSGNKAEIIAENGFSFSVEKSKLHKIAPKHIEKKEVIYTSSSLDSLGSTSLKMELYIIGLYADEARMQLDKYLDACRVKGFHRVRIIHGFGSGALRKMVKQYCDAHKDFIEKYEAASESEGAGGATIVYLK
ncbi:MAG: Smr/MutS family protein [Bacilli bacterium]|nr:Smr/MutS family protein [Bacilli bacterium]